MIAGLNDQPSVLEAVEARIAYMRPHSLGWFRDQDDDRRSHRRQHWLLPLQIHHGLLGGFQVAPQDLLADLSILGKGAEHRIDGSPGSELTASVAAQSVSNDPAAGIPAHRQAAVVLV